LRVLIVEDNPAIASHLIRSLQNLGFSVEHAESAADGQRLSLAHSFAAILLSLVLPDMDGLACCRSMRQQNIKAPILIVCPTSGPEERNRALLAGADDCITKVVPVNELAARLHAICRHDAASCLRFHDLELDLPTRVMRRSAAACPLRPKEFALLECLMRRPEHAFTRAELGQHVWKSDFDVHSNLIEVYISTLRKKIGEPSLIYTITGVGYRLGRPEQNPA
jgi:DNA-binding response OmpR family regulator